MAQKGCLCLLYSFRLSPCTPPIYILIWSPTYEKINLVWHFVHNYPSPYRLLFTSLNLHDFDRFCSLDRSNPGSEMFNQRHCVACKIFNYALDSTEQGASLQSFIITLPSFFYLWNTVEKDAESPNNLSCYKIAHVLGDGNIRCLVFENSCSIPIT